MIAVDGVGTDRRHQVVWAEAVELHRFDGSQHIAHPADAKDTCHLPDLFFGDSISLDHRLPAGLFHQQLQALFGLDVVDAHNGVHVQDVVDPCYVFVADSLDVVPPISAPIYRRTLDRFESHDLMVRPYLFQPVAGGDGSCRTHG